MELGLTHVYWKDGWTHTSTIPFRTAFIGLISVPCKTKRLHQWVPWLFSKVMQLYARSRICRICNMHIVSFL